ncbi:MAG: glycosyltransferase family 39 protein [Elusimicrobia bacterium]|nr:glycosyltransferase family 39 protein [Elusimicrobiota bacterium]
MKSSIWEKPAFHVAVQIVLGIALHLNRPWLGGLQGWDDAWYAAGALGMLESRDFLTPMINGSPAFFTAPPLFYAFLALSFAVFGATTFAAKFVGGVCTIAAVLAVFFTARQLFRSLWVAALAATVFNLDPFILKFGHHAVAHTAWACVVTLALGALHQARRKPAFYFAFSVFSALSILFKSLLGALPLAIGGLWLVWDRAKRKELLYFSGAAGLAIALGSLWFWVEYFRFGHMFLEEHFGEMLFRYSRVDKFVEVAPMRLVRTVTSLARASFLGFIFLPLNIGFLWKRNTSESRLLILWILVPLACLVGVRVHDPKYVAPFFAGMALGSGWLLDYFLSVRMRRNLLSGIYALGLVWILVSVAFPVSTGRDHLANTGVLIEKIRSQVPPQGRWILVVKPYIPLDPRWPNRMFVEYIQPDGIVNQILFYARRHFAAIHPQDLRTIPDNSIVFAYHKDLSPGSSPHLKSLLEGPGWTLYRFAL